MGERLTPEEALRRYWSAFCDADWHLIDDDACEDGGDVSDAWEAAGLAELRAVTDEDLDDAFAAERGVLPGGFVWQLTPAGRQAVAQAGAIESADQPAESERT